MSCGIYPFGQIGANTANEAYPSASTFVLSGDPRSIDIRIEASVWDHDGPGNADDMITSASRDLWFSSLEQASSNMGLDKVDPVTGNCIWTEETPLQNNETAIAQMLYSVEVFPNACRDEPYGL